MSLKKKILLCTLCFAGCVLCVLKAAGDWNYTENMIILGCIVLIYLGVAAFCIPVIWKEIKSLISKLGRP